MAATAPANAWARTELRGFAEEQAALRPVATLVARGASPEEMFGAVDEEVALLMGIVQTNMLRCDPDGFATTVGADALGGRFSLDSPPGAGHPILEVALPLDDPTG